MSFNTLNSMLFNYQQNSIKNKSLRSVIPNEPIWLGDDNMQEKKIDANIFFKTDIDKIIQERKDAPFNMDTLNNATIGGFIFGALVGFCSGFYLYRKV